MGLFEGLFTKQKIYGTLTTTTGAYEGDLVDGEPHGRASFLDDRSRYEGDFVKGIFAGKGVMDYTVPIPVIVTKEIL